MKYIRVISFQGASQGSHTSSCLSYLLIFLFPFFRVVLLLRHAIKVESEDIKHTRITHHQLPT